MALTTTGNVLADAGKSGSAPAFMTRLQLLGDNAYPTGGYPSIGALIESKVGRALRLVDVIGAGGVYTVRYDNANDKLLVYDASGAQVANNGDLSAVTFTVTVFAQ